MLRYLYLLNDVYNDVTIQIELDELAKYQVQRGGQGGISPKQFSWT